MRNEAASLYTLTPRSVWEVGIEVGIIVVAGHEHGRE